MGKNISTNINNNLSCKYSQTFFVHAKKSAGDTLTKEKFKKQQKQLVI